MRDVLGEAERVIYQFLMDHPGLDDAQGLADHIADVLAAHDLLAADEQPEAPVIEG